MDPTYRIRNSEAQKRRSENPNFVEYHRNATRLAMIPLQNTIQKEARKSQTNFPTRLEEIILDTINNYQLPYEYTGDGTKEINGYKPDFTATDGKKKLIEVFGTYYHKEIDEFDKQMLYRKFGYDLLVLWEEEIYSLSEEAQVMLILWFHNK